MKDAKIMETTSLVLLLSVVFLAPLIIFLVKSATSTIQVSHITHRHRHQSLNCNLFSELCKHFGGTNSTAEPGKE